MPLGADEYLLCVHDLGLPLRRNHRSPRDRQESHGLPKAGPSHGSQGLQNNHANHGHCCQDRWDGGSLGRLLPLLSALRRADGPYVRCGRVLSKGLSQADLSSSWPTSPTIVLYIKYV